jgi:hypothetical protein
VLALDDQVKAARAANAMNQRRWYQGVSAMLTIKREKNANGYVGGWCFVGGGGGEGVRVK